MLFSKGHEGHSRRQSLSRRFQGRQPGRKTSGVASPSRGPSATLQPPPDHSQAVKLMCFLPALDSRSLPCMSRGPHTLCRPLHPWCPRPLHTQGQQLLLASAHCTLLGLLLAERLQTSSGLAEPVIYRCCAGGWNTPAPKRAEALLSVLPQVPTPALRGHTVSSHFTIVIMVITLHIKLSLLKLLCALSSDLIQTATYILFNYAIAFYANLILLLVFHWLLTYFLQQKSLKCDFS